MKTFFVTDTKIDPKSWSMIGVSAKPNSINPIGRFGTGLKYAIAISLRLGWQIKITNYIDGVPDEHVFSQTKDTFRGSDINIVYDNNTALPFTMHYGSHWEPWTVLRELYSNTMDEDGKMYFDAQNIQNGSVIEIDSADFHDLARGYGDYFLTNDDHLSDIVHDYDNLQVLKGKYTGKIFFKNVYVGELKKARYGYNIHDKVCLTEDRTIKDTWSLGWDIVKIISSSEHPESMNEWITSKNYEEESFAVPSYVSWSESFKEAVSNARINHPSTLMNYLKSLIPPEKAVYNTVELESIQSIMLEQALGKIKRAGFNVDFPIKFIKTEDKNLIAFVEDGEIHLSLEAFKNMDYLVSTLIEELAHCLGYLDETRSYETYLCDSIARLVSII
jgi:hypothetical protein